MSVTYNSLNTCVCCGKEIPEGKQVCEECWGRLYEQERKREETRNNKLRDQKENEPQRHGDKGK